MTKLSNSTLKNLEPLSKDELVEIIANYWSVISSIDKALIEASNSHENPTYNILEELSKLKYSLSDKTLKADILYNLNKISAEEYKNLLKTFLGAD